MPPKSTTPDQHGIEPHVSMRQAAERLGCSISFVSKICDRGLLSYVKLPGRNGKRLLPVAELAKLLQEYRVPSKQELLRGIEI